MKSSTTRAFVTLPLIYLVAACQSDPDASKQNLAATFAEIGATIAAGDLDSFVSHYSASPLHLPPGAAMNSTRDQVKEFLQDKLGLYEIQGEPTIQYSDDASMAYVFGTYTTKADPSRELESYRGRFITIWRRSINRWECVVDIWNSDDPRFAHL